MPRHRALFLPPRYINIIHSFFSTLRLKRDGTRAETRFRLPAKRTIPFKSVGASVQSTTGSRGVRISGSNAGYTMFRGSVTGTGYPLHSPVSPSLPLPCVTVCHHISTGVYMTEVQDKVAPSTTLLLPSLTTIILNRPTVHQIQYSREIALSLQSCG